MMDSITPAQTVASRKALLVDYDYCCGCHTCEIACQKEHGLAPGEWGITVLQIGPQLLAGSKQIIYDFIPIPTKLCDLCAQRVAAGKLPTCVQHCQTNCMKYGDVDELASELNSRPRQMIIAPR